MPPPPFDPAVLYWALQEVQHEQNASGSPQLTPMLVEPSSLDKLVNDLECDTFDSSKTNTTESSSTKIAEKPKAEAVVKAKEKKKAGRKEETKSTKSLEKN